MSFPLSPSLAHGILAQAPAATDATAGPGGLFGNQFVFFGLMIVMFWFVLIRPQRNRQKQQEALLKALKVGDDVVTIGGAHGTITSLKEKTAIVRIADGVKVEYDRSAIATVVAEEKSAAS